VEAARYAAGAETRDFDIAVVHAGEVVDLINDLPPAAVIVERVESQAIRLLSNQQPSSIGMRLTNCTLKLKKDWFADSKSHPHKIRPRAVTRCSVENSVLGRLGALFRIHLKIIRLSGPPALK
jgi:hypothetical protein